MTTAPGQQDELEPEAPPRLSLTQVLAGALAAVTTTFALSYLGVLGTIAGAALASILSVVGNHYYLRSIERTRHHVRQLPQRYPPRRGRAAGAPTVALGSTAVGAPAPAEPDPSGEGAPAGEYPPRRDRRALLLSVAAVFLVILAAVTVLELALGKPLTALLRNEQGSGTSVFGGAPAVQPTSTPATSDPAPTTSSTAPTTTTTTTTPTSVATEPPPVSTTTATPPATTAATEPAPTESPTTP